MLAPQEELTDKDRATLGELRQLAYARIVDPAGAFVAGYEMTLGEGDAQKRYDEWIASRPHDMSLFARLAASAYRLCQAGKFNLARQQLTIDFLTSRIPAVDAFVRRMPEIVVLISDVMRDDEGLKHVLYVLSQLLPAQNQGGEAA